MTQHSATRWGVLHWSPEHQQAEAPEVIHKDDLNRWTTTHPYGGYFECVGEELGYLILTDGNATYRVQSHLFKTVKSPSKRIGETVKVQSNGSIVTAIIFSIHWHYKRNEAFYHVQKNGKPATKRYWDSDFR